mmetsp:Transcript_43284/g.112480  ORF Transcript_43284/g.112480 Transcript_43284/m.112480 type:complete len:403 (+) Transcript_43284:666-1874(+)
MRMSTSLPPFVVVVVVSFLFPPSSLLPPLPFPFPAPILLYALIWCPAFSTYRSCNIMPHSHPHPSPSFCVSPPSIHLSLFSHFPLTPHVQTDGVKKVRLFGKIEGTQKNYYIAETRFEEGKRPKAGGEEEEEKGEEEKKEGQIAAEGEGEGPYVESTNYYVYYASNSPDGPWVQLPDVSHDMIIAARKMKKFFTGDLNTPVIVNPPFPTTVKRAAGDKRVHRAAESDLLRAQLARIAHTTTLCRQKYFKLAGEEEEESEEKEEGASEVVIEDVNEVLPPVDANQVEFMHMHSDILKQGGCKFVGAPEEGEEEEAEAEGEEGEEKKPKKKIVVEKNQPKLAPIKSDGKVHGKEAWSVRVCNGNIPECAVAVARSNLWAGAVTVSSPYKLVNFYSGYGIKSDAK